MVRRNRTRMDYLEKFEEMIEAYNMGSKNVEAFFDDLDEFDRATSGSQVLVISPRDHEISDDVCSQFLTAGDVSRRNVLYVTTKQPASERLQVCQGNDDWVGGKVGVVEMGDTGTSRDADLGSIAGEEIVHDVCPLPTTNNRTAPRISVMS